MPRLSKRTENWLTLIALGVGIPIAAVAGVLFYMSSTVALLHPSAQDVKSVMQSAPAPRWASAAEQGRRLVRAGIAQQNLPGISVAVAVGQDVVWAEGFGWADIENNVPVAPGTRFRIGHVSKSLTSAAVGVLLEKGRLRLDDELQAHVPAFPRKAWPITLRQLMGHMAGVRHYLGEEADVPSAHCERAADGLRSFADDPLLFEPETQTRYSTYGWVLVSAAVEAAAGEPFFTFMRTQIFERTGMTDTMPDSVDQPMANRATFYFPRFSGDNQLGSERARSVDYSCFAGAGAFLSTPTDLVRFGMAMSRDTLLRPDTIRMLQTPQVLASGKDTGLGLGWALETVPLAGEPTQLVSHASRSLVGGSTSFLIFPDPGTGNTSGQPIIVAVTSNTSYAGTRSIALGIAEVFAGDGNRRQK